MAAVVLPIASLSAPTLPLHARDRRLVPIVPECVVLESGANLSEPELDWKDFAFDGGFLDGDGRSCDASMTVVNTNDQCGGKVELTGETCLDEDAAADEGTPIKTLAVVRGRWGAAFFHWVAEQLPRVAYVHEQLLDPKSQPARLVVDCAMENGQSSPFVRETLQLLGLTDEQIVCREDKLAYRTKHGRGTLLSPPETPCGNTQARGASLLRSRVLPPSLRPASSSTQRVVLYKRSGIRELTTHEDVLKALRAQYADHEIVEVSGGEISMREQLETYATARCQVGPHGAGLVLMMFAPDDFGTAEVTPGNYWASLNGDAQPNGCFKGVALTLGQRHEWLLVEDATAESTLTAEPADVVQLAAKVCGASSEEAAKEEEKKTANEEEESTANEEKKAAKDERKAEKAKQKAEKEEEEAGHAKEDGEASDAKDSASAADDGAAADDAPAPAEMDASDAPEEGSAPPTPQQRLTPHSLSERDEAEDAEASDDAPLIAKRSTKLVAASNVSNSDTAAVGNEKRRRGCHVRSEVSHPPYTHPIT